MKTFQSFDVLVVGLGPAGASAAAFAAQGGLRVLAMERNAEPGLPVQCAEFVPMMIDNAGIPASSFSVQPIEFMNTYISDYDNIEGTPDFRGHMIDRAQFDRNLISKAIDHGVDCRFSTPLVEINELGQAVLSDGEVIQAKTIIGADGPRSICGKSIGQVNRELVATRQITVDLLRKHHGTDIFLSEEYLGGYAWLFPKADKCHIGLGVKPELKANLKPLLEELHEKLISEGRVGREIHAHTGGLIPVSGPLNPAGFVNETAILLTGDAAGLTNPITGAGINAAVISGQLAGEAAVGFCEGDEDYIDDFRDEIKSLFGTSSGHAVRRRKELLQNFENDGGLSAQNMKRGWVAFDEFWQKAPEAEANLNITEKSKRMTA